jgi:hypothetical protein
MITALNEDAVIVREAYARRQPGLVTPYRKVGAFMRGIFKRFEIRTVSTHAESAQAHSP